MTGEEYLSFISSLSREEVIEILEEAAKLGNTALNFLREENNNEDS